VSFPASDTPRIAAEYAERTPQDILRLAYESFDRVAIAFSGAEDVVLIDMARKIRDDVEVFCLDTGRLHPETYRFIDRVREKYGVQVETLFPDAARVQELVKKKGLFSFFADGHQECCSIRKVGPLKKKLGVVDAWITGQRKDQSPDTRANVAVVEEDKAFTSADHRVVKLNPLASWSSARVWAYIKENDVPFNELHKQGFVSIGCEPCTRAILPGEHERAGRWWWEEATKKECGLHVKPAPGGGK
jgi:phosphoadenosine phosphosulfate reductase